MARRAPDHRTVPLAEWKKEWLVLECAGLLSLPRYATMTDAERGEEGYPRSRDEMIALVEERRRSGPPVRRPDPGIPQVLNKHRGGIPDGAVYVGRGSKWGNPFRIGPDGDRDAVIARHEAWLRGERALLGSLEEIRGRPLVCFCAPAACHGDLLLFLANADREAQVAWWRGRPFRAEAVVEEGPTPVSPAAGATSDESMEDDDGRGR